VHIGDLRYAQSGDVSIAWQRFGDPEGVPVIVIPPLATSVEMVWG
jgi:hypothetical protein